MSDFTTMRRARLSPSIKAKETVLGSNDCDNLLQPLWPTNGVIWPYTPDVVFGAQANYENFQFTHSNFQYWQYRNSTPNDISVTGEFTAQTNEEARYMLAVLHFLRSMTEMEFGISAAQRGVAGTPPPVLRFNYLGSHMFNNVPVVVSSFSYALAKDVDYVEVKIPGSEIRDTRTVLKAEFGNGIINKDQRTYLPTKMTLSAVLSIQENPKTVREEFDLDKFKNGDLLNRGFV